MTEFLTGAASALEAMLSLAVTALPVMAAVLLTRWVLAKLGAPKKIAYALWAVPGFRLVCPVTFSSALSLFNTVTPLADATVPAAPAAGGLGLSAVEFGGDLARGTRLIPPADLRLSAAAVAPDPAALALRIGAVIWLLGLAAIIIYSLVSYFRLKRRLNTAVALEGNVCRADSLTTPFVLGLFHPKIYLPFSLEGEDRVHVLLHERTHLRRGDPWWKLLAFAVAAAYWWDPAVWLCYALFCQDMEMSCDEAVLRTCGAEIKRAYSLSLVDFAAERRFPAANPLAFGENDAGKRIKNVLNWKRAGAPAVFLSVSACLLMAVICCTNADTKKSWVKVESADGGAAFTCNLAEPIRSWAVYQDIYEDGAFLSSSLLIMDDCGTGPDGRRFSYTLTHQASWETGSRIAGADVTLRGSGGLNAVFPIPLPKESYTGAGSVVGEEVYPNRPKVRYDLDASADSHDVDLMWYALSTEPTGTITYYHADNGLVGSNDTVISYRFVTSSRPMAESFRAAAAPAFSQRLYDLKTPYVGDASAVGHLLRQLGVADCVGRYTLNLFTSERPYGLELKFSSMPEDIDPASPSVDGAMRAYSMLLLALIDNLEQVKWSYPTREDGQSFTRTAQFTEEDANAYLALLSGDLGLPTIKECGGHVNTLSALIRQVSLPSGSNGDIACVVTAEGTGKSVAAAWYPDGNFDFNYDALPVLEAADGDTLHIFVNGTAETLEVGEDAYLRSGDPAVPGTAVWRSTYSLTRDPSDGGFSLAAGSKADGPPLSATYFISHGMTKYVCLVNFGGPEIEEEPFTGVLGCDGTAVRTADRRTLFGTTHYLADGVCVAESWGHVKLDTAADLDGDGTRELVCQGVQDVLVYRRSGGGIEVADAGALLDVAYEDRGAGSIGERYVPESGQVEIFYASVGGGEYLTASYPLDGAALAKLDFQPFVPTCDGAGNGSCA